MTTGIVLIEGESVQEDSLRIPLSNALQIIIGNGPGFGFILHLAANTIDDFNNALSEFSKIAEVRRVLNLAIRTRP